MAEDRNRLRATFDGAALLYDEVRPGYPEELFDDVVSLSGIQPGGRVLEIGCGTGRATVPGHIGLDPASRERLFRGISDVIESEYGGRIVKGYLTTLYVAHRK